MTGHRKSQKKTWRNGRRTGVAGSEFVHVYIDDATSLAYVEVPRRRASHHGRRVIAPGGRLLCHPRHLRPARDERQRRSTIQALACPTMGLRHLRTRPYRPRTNGKAERFIRAPTMLAGWAYGAIYATSAERTTALDGWLWTYKHRRSHGALSHKPPIARLNELNNLPGTYT